MKPGRRELRKAAEERMLADGALAPEKLAEYVGLSLEEVDKLFLAFHASLSSGFG